MRSAAEILREHHIEMPATSPGRYYAACPECSAKRKAPHQKLKCLGVTIDADGVHYGCNHCGWKGGARYTATNGGNGTAQAQPSRKVAEYVYRTADGEPYLRVDRYDNKSFPQYHWTGNAWAKGKPKGPKIPYRLPEMLTAVHHTVFIVEGEKDADTLTERGFVATTSPEGAGKWTADLNQWFIGKTVYIIPDADEPGRKHAQLVAANLHGVAREVRIVELPAKDVTDWISGGGDTGQIIDIAKAAPLWVPPDADTDMASGNVFFSALDLQRMRFPPINYVVTGYIVEGLTLLAGRPKRGKSWLLLHAAIAVASGGYTLGDVKCVEGDVFYAALEDNRRRLQRRMQKLLPAFAQEWPERLHFATEMPRLKDGGIEMVRRWIEQAKEPRLIIIDTLQKVRNPKGADQNGYEADYAAVSELKALADEYGVAIVLVHHQRKMEAEDPVDTVSGTTGLTGAVDTVLVLNNSGQGMTLYGRGRDIEEIEKAVTFDVTSCLWRVEGEAQEVRRTDERSVILVTLKEADEALTPTDIAGAIGQPLNNVKQLLFKMSKAGEVLKVPGRRGQYVHPDRADLYTPDNHDNPVTNGYGGHRG